jgi:ParB/RepB/Spo0J family partition protein
MSKKKTLTAADRARIAAVQKARWAKHAKKKPAAASDAATTGSSSRKNSTHVNGNGAKREAGSLPGSRLTKAARDGDKAGRLKAAAATLSSGTLMQLDPKSCRRSPWNREDFDEDELKKLVADVKEHGVNQNGIVRKNPGTEVEEIGGEFIVKSRGGGMLIAKFSNKRPALELSNKLDAPEWEIIAGERRWTAAMRAGRPFPAVDRKATDVEALELQATENMLREDLNPMDEATKFEQLRAAYIAEGLSKMDALKRIMENTGKAESTVLERLTLVGLPEVVQAMIRKNELHASQAGLLTKINDPSTIAKLAGEMRKDADGESMAFRDAKKRVEAAVQVEKNLAEWQRKKEEFEKKQFTVLSVGYSEEILGFNEWRDGDFRWWVEKKEFFVAPDTTCDLPGAQWRDYSKLWKKAPNPVLARLPNGRAVVIYVRSEADEAVKAGGKLKSAQSGRSSGRPDSEVRAEREKKEHRAEFVSAVPGIVEYSTRNADTLDFWKFYATAAYRHSGSDSIKLVAKRRWSAKGNDAHKKMEEEMKAMTAAELRGLCTELLLSGDWPHTYSGGWGEMIRQGAALSGQQLSVWGKSQTSGGGEDAETDHQDQDE